MTRGDAFWSVVCDYRQHLWLLLMFLLFLLVLTALSFLFGELGTASYTIAVVNLLLILGVGSVAGGMYWYCGRRRPDY